MLEKFTSMLTKKKPLFEDIPQPVGIEKIIAVASGKGGVGKSTTAATLAFLLSSMNRKVGVLDADVYGPSMTHIFKAAKIGTGSLDKTKVEPKLFANIKVISAGMFAPKEKAQILRGPMAGNLVKQFYSEVSWGDLHYLILDLPPGTGDIQLTLAQNLPITTSVIVTTPEEIATNDVEKAIQMFHILNIPIAGIVETMSYFTCDSCDKRHSLYPGNGGTRLSEKFGIPLLAQIPFDPQLNRDLDQGLDPVSIHPQMPSLLAYRSLVRGLESTLQSAPSSDRLSSFQLDWRT